MQGFNMGRYVPPDVEGTISGNKLNKKHPLGSRASKAGSLTVRFEMPFAVWCGTCPKPTIIGQGVRFNAAKTRVGAYHSTPIFAFRMRHAECGGAIEVRTDPKNTAYVVTEGGRRRDDAEGKLKEGDWEIMTDAEREKLRGNAFAKLEKTIEDREQLIVAKQRVEELQETNNRTWDDPYEMNRRLRKEFRVGRHQREKGELKTEELKDRMGLDIELVPENEEDKRRAGLVDFGPVIHGQGEDHIDTQGLNRPSFQIKSKTQLPEPNKRLKSEAKAELMKENLVAEIIGNTRVAKDPFLNFDRDNLVNKGPSKIPGLKRKRIEGSEPEDDRKSSGKEDNTVLTAAGATRPKTGVVSTTLVAYGSDSD